MKCVLNKFRNKDSRTLTNGHLSTTATFFVPADSPYIGSCLNLSTTATSLQQKRLLKRVPNCQNNLSTTASFFQRLMKKSRMVMKLDSYGALMINRGNRTLFVIHLGCCSKHKFHRGYDTYSETCEPCWFCR